MPFEFLRDIPFQQIGGLVKQGVGLYNAFDTRSPEDELSPILQNYLNTIARAQDYINVANRPTSKRFRDVADVYSGLAEEDIVNAAQSVSRQHGRDRARGGTGFFATPERRDEAILSAILRNTYRAKAQAREVARASLLQSSGAQLATAAPQAPLLNIFQQYADENRKNRFGGYEAIGDVIGGLGGLFGGGGGQGIPRPRPQTGRSPGRGPDYR